MLLKGFVLQLVLLRAHATDDGCDASEEHIVKEALQRHWQCPPGELCKGNASATPPPLFTPTAIPGIDYSDPSKTKALWQAPTQKTYDNGVRSPALGWNSWNQFNLDVNETKVLAVAQAMKNDGLLGSGFEYIVIDDGWATSDRDSAGRMQADPTKFPRGIKWLAEQLHSLGFKFGIYTSVGEKTCGGGQPGIMGHHQIDAETFAAWGVDYVKVDRCGWPGEVVPGLDLDDFPELIRMFEGVDYPKDGKYHKSFYRITGRVQGYQNFSAALNATGRTMYLEICDWGEDDTLEFAPQIGNSFRMLWDNFPQWHRIAEIYSYFARVLAVPASTSPGAYAYADMLEGGVDGHLYNRDIFPKSSLTEREAATEHAMWSMWSSALILGYDVSNPEKAWVTDLLKNSAMLKINQDPLGIAARLAIRNQQEGGCVFTTGCFLTDVWVKPLAEGAVAVALVNMAGTITQNDPRYSTESISVSWDVLGLDDNTSVAVYSVTEQTPFGTMSGSLSVEVKPHAAHVLVLTPRIGVRG